MDNNKELKNQLLEKEALDLRVKGYSYVEIGAKLGITYQKAAYIIRNHMKQVRTDTEENAAEIRQLELKRIDYAIKNLSDGIDIGDTRSINSLLKAIEMRSKIIGLFAAESIVIKSEEQLSDELLKRDVSSMSDTELNQFFSDYLEANKE